MKNIFEFGEKRTKRNYTVYDLLKLKGKKKLTQVNVMNGIEAYAAAQANIDMFIGPFHNIDEIRANAPHQFYTAVFIHKEHHNKDDLLKASMTALENGADAIYTPKNPHVVEYLARESVPVMAHLGFIPVKSTWSGGIRGAGKSGEEAYKLYQQFKDMENAGAFAVESEIIAENVLTEISKRTSMVTVSLGSGNGGDVNYLFMCDICGENEIAPRHAIKYGNLLSLHKKTQKERIQSLKKFNKEAKKNNFAKKKNIVSITKKELNEFLDLI